MSRRTYGTGTVYRDNRRGRWVARSAPRIDPATGKRKRVTVVGLPGESKRSVADRLQERLAQLDQVGAGPASVGQLVRDWREKRAPDTQSPRTLAMTDSLIAAHIEPALGPIPVTVLTADRIEAFLEARSYLSRSTLEKLRRILFQAYRFGQRRTPGLWNPVDGVVLPRAAGRTREGRALTASELRTLLNVAEGHRLGSLAVVGATLGLRPGELTGLCWDAINLEAGTLTVFRSLAWIKGQPSLKGTKTGRTRTLALPAITAEALAHQRRISAEERLHAGQRWPARWADLVYVSEAGTPINPSNLRRLVSRWAEEAGIGSLTPYDFRHTATSLIAAGGLSAERLAELLGHRDTRMVFTHYKHPVTSAVATAVDFWDASRQATAARRSARKLPPERTAAETQ